ncbi:hypothetical protein [Orlajensenia leifsoniae]|uniref:Uncharacterized protein n=1 Tax=Orlajensenia leifsoniae TaxID=2561933 RepID=A0A4Y9QZM8_9MICO|nr:hypothetical protein [Leifsonia flava]TFV96703.1 hypothetical protein E4M00_11490 [Leifsonia flava]
MRADRILAAGAAGVLLLGLTGCSGAASQPQSVTVDYTIDGDAKSADVAIPGLACQTLGERVFYSTTAARNGDDPLPFVANADGGSYESVIVTLQVTDDLWFTSGKPFTATEDGVSFDGVVGGVGPLDDSGLPTVALDGAATLTGDLDCTEKK